MTIRTNALWRLSIPWCLALFAACDGGGEKPVSSTPPVTSPPVVSPPPVIPPPTSGEIIVSGYVAKGVVTGARVRASQIVGGAASGTPRMANLSSEGAYSLSMPKGLILFELIPDLGASTRDESTGANVPLPASFVFRSVADTSGLTGATAQAHITPFTEIVTSLALRLGGLTAENVTIARAGVAAMIGADPITTAPIQIDRLDPIASTAQQQRVSVLNAAVSHMANSDAFGCKRQENYGEQIRCTVERLGLQVSVQTAAASSSSSATILSAPATIRPSGVISDVGSGLISLSFVGAKAVATGIVAVGTAVQAASTAAVVGAVTIAESIAFVYTDAFAFQKMQSEISGSSSHQIMLSSSYIYAHLSKYIYDIEANATVVEPSDIFFEKSDTQGRRLPTGWTMIKWSSISAAARPRTFASGLAFNVLVNETERQIVVAYRGTTELNDWWTNILNTFTCDYFSTQYVEAAEAFRVLMNDLPVGYRSFDVVTTGHSLGGGLASYIAKINPQIVKKAFIFNSAPLCVTERLQDIVKGEDNSKIHSIVLRGEAVRTASLGFLVSAYFPGDDYYVPAPVRVLTPIDSAQAHFMGSVLTAVDYGHERCKANNCIPTPVVVALVTTEVAVSSTLAQGTIRLTGRGLTGLQKVTLACTRPDGSTCSGSPQVLTPANWFGKVDIDTDQSLILRPILVDSADSGNYGLYTWSITLLGHGGSAASVVLRVSYARPATDAPIIRSIQSSAFSPGTSVVLAQTTPFSAQLILTGQALDTVQQIEIKRSGATAVDETWNIGDANWQSVVRSQTEGSISIHPTLVSVAASWTGDTVWTVTVRDARGQVATAAFTVRRGSAAAPVGMVEPSLQSPANHAVGASLTPTISWSGGSAIFWQINIRNAATDQRLPAVTVPAGQFDYTIPAGPLLPGTRYKWDVTACPDLACNNASIYKVSLDRYFTTASPTPLGAPALLAPAVGEAGVATTKVLSWTSVTGANGYWLMVAAHPSAFPADLYANSCPACLVSGSTNATSHLPSSAFPMNGPGNTVTLAGGTTYYWRVQAFNSNGISGLYSVTGSFTTAAAIPAVVTPTVSTASVNVTNAASGFQEFAIAGSGFTANSWHQLSVNNGAWNDASSAPTNISVSSITVAVSRTLAVGTSVRIRVCAAQNSGGTNCSTGLVTATLVAPAAVTPTVNSASVNVTNAASGFQEFAVSGSGFTANSWHQLSVNNGAWNDASSAPTTISVSSITVAVSRTLAVGTSVRIRVCAAQNSGGTNCSTGLVTATLVASALVAPTLSAPSNNATGVSLTPALSWSAAVAPNLQLNVRDTVTSLMVRTENLSAAATSYTVPAGVLAAGRRYRWNVSACPNVTCNTGYVVSSSFEFTTRP